MDTAATIARVADLHGQVVADYLSTTYPAALPLIANGWTLHSALDHVQGMCDRVLCTGKH